VSRRLWLFGLFLLTLKNANSLQVRYDPGSGRVVSSSYDKTVRVWNLMSAGATPVGCLDGAHPAPVMELDVSSDGLALSGEWALCKLVGCLQAC
jgi:WD40 repeat protein